jgi:hypothetical protein
MDDDTAKMVRPKFPRNPHGPRGRVEHDSRGNAVWKKTRASDSMEPPDTSALAIVEDAIVEDAAGKSWDGHKKHQTQKSDISALTPDDKTKRK